MDPRVLRMFDHGDSIHQLIMKPLFGLRDIHVVASEVNIPPQEIISGRVDAVVSDGKDLYVLDIKSMNGMIFNNLKEPKPEHINQVQLYLHFLKQKKGILLYVNKDTQGLKEFFVDYNREIADPLLRDLQALKQRIDSDIIPCRLADWPQNWQCKYCQFKDICSLAGAGEINWQEFKDKASQQEQKEQQRFN